MDGPDASPGFGRLLRGYRRRAGLTQERLAERAGISAKAVGAVEQGTRRAPHRQTVLVLADALELSPAERETLYQTAGNARGRVRRDRMAPATTTLPVPLTPFIERPEVNDIGALLDRHRLVTITGAGGVGKTRTAIEVCSRRMLETSIPIVFVDLTPALDGGLVLTKIASALDVNLAGPDPIGSLTAGIGSRELVLVLDNCEHIIAEAAHAMSRLLSSCASLSILATSREVLSLSSEVVYRLPSLKTPARPVATMEEAQTYSAMALFLQRASFADATRELGIGDMSTVAEICRQLDGIPLAIELAASQVPTMGLTGLRSRLHSLFDVAGPRDVPARHQTMRATIAWSFDLLDRREQIVLMRASVFSGGFTIEAAESVTTLQDIDPGEILALVKALCAKSLVNVDRKTGSTRYSLLDSIRTFGREMLEKSEDAPATARRHAQWLAELADGLLGKPQSVLRNAQGEIDNARAAIAWCLLAGSQEMLRLATRIVCGMRRLWMMSGRTAELDRLIVDMLAKLDDVDANDQAVGDLYVSRISITNNIEKALVEEAAPFLARSVNVEEAALVHVRLALSEARAGRPADATASYSRAAAYFDADARRRSGRNYIHYRCIGVWLHAARGDVGAAHADVVDLQSEAERDADADQLAGVYQLRAEIESASGNFAAAIELCQTLLQTCAEEQTFYQIGTTMSNLSCYHLMIGNLSEADRFGTLALERLSEWQNDRRNWDAIIAMQHLATVWALRCRPHVAAMLLGFIDHYRASVVWRLPATDQRGYDMLVRSVREQLREEDVALQRARGAALDYDAAVELLQMQDE
jgi:predicted ATPase/DNA-binding XRE family transcriptional regulator